MAQRNLVWRVMATAFLLGLAFWLLDGVAELFYFGQDFRRVMFEPPQTLLDVWLLRIPPRTLFVRLSFMITCLAGGLLSAHYIAAQRRSEQRYQSYIDNAPLGVLVTDTQGHITQVNPAVCALTGYERTELLSMSVNDLYDPQDRDDIQFYVAEIAHQGRVSIETVARRKDGTPFNLHLDAVALPGDRLMAFGQDTTIRYALEMERQQAVDALTQSEAEVRRSAEQLAATIDIQHDLAAPLDQRTIWDRFGRGVQQLFPDVATVLIASYDREQNLIVAEYGIQDGAPVDTSALPAIPLAPSGKGIQSQVIRTRQPLVIDSNLKEKLVNTNVAVRVGSDDRETQSALYAPMLAQDRVLGVVQLQSYTPSRFRDPEVKLLSLIANTAAVSIENARLYELARNEIAERERTENLLRYHRQLLDQVGEVAKIGGWEFDPQTGRGTWTEQVARIHGVDPHDETDVELGKSFYHGESRARIEQAIQEAIELGKPYDLELELVSAQGIHKWVHTIGRPVVQDGRVINVHGSLQDITERKQAEAQLAEQLDELRRWHRATLGREGRIIDLKREVNALLARAGQPPRYPGAESGSNGSANPVPEDRMAPEPGAE